MGQERQLVAFPASFGFMDLRNCLRDPRDEMLLGRWGGSELPGAGEQSIHSSQSMSWQLFVRRLGAVADSLRQLPRT